VKMSIQQSILSRHLDNAAKFLPKKDIIPILSHIVLSATAEGLEIIAGNSDTFIKSVISTDDVKIDITIDRVGMVAIPGQKLTEIVDKMSGLITFESESDQVEIKSGKSEFVLSVGDPKEYPAFPVVNGASITMTGKDLKELVTTTAYAISTSEGTPMLMGILITQQNGMLKLTATDRHRLSYIKSESEGDNSQAVVDGKTLVELSKIIGDGEIEISFNNAMLIRSSDFTFYSRVIEGSYPETEKIIPRTFTTELSVVKRELIAALDRIMIVAKESKTFLMKLTINKNEIMIESKQETKKARESIDIKTFSGEELAIGINGKYLSEALKVIDSPEIEICLNGKLGPIIVRGKDETAYHLVLPYRTEV
jgi:DNA polymerase-3 subunit beta